MSSINVTSLQFPLHLPSLVLQLLRKRKQRIDGMMYLCGGECRCMIVTAVMSTSSPLAIANICTALNREGKTLNEKSVLSQLTTRSAHPVVQSYL